MAEVHLPVVGGVSKKALLIGGTAAAAVVALIYIRKRKSGAATSTAAADTGAVTDPTIDPATGLPYADETTAAITKARNRCTRSSGGYESGSEPFPFR